MSAVTTDTQRPAARRFPGSAGWTSDHRRRRCEQRELVLRARDGGDREREELVDAYLPLIAGVARSYRGASAVEHAELMQEGVVGLLRALERYDPELGTPFWAYATWWVRQAMQQLVAELSGPIVLSDRALRQLVQIKAAQRAFGSRQFREPSLRELEGATGVTREHVERLVAAARPAQAFDEPLGDAGSPLSELLADRNAEDAYEQVMHRDVARRLPAMLAQLSHREADVVRARYGFDGCERTLREIGDGLGVSAERVRQIEAASLGKLREAALPGAVATGGSDAA
jgi:RNA polymerase sigma factor (sigma-70 family)